MEILYLLIPLSLVLVGLIIWVFLWAVRSGQFDDLEGPAHQILMDDDRPVTGQSQQALDETDGKPPATSDTGEVIDP
jgi:cbb3-type cytochrome oxidase maturation protein